MLDFMKGESLYIVGYCVNEKRYAPMRVKFVDYKGAYLVSVVDMFGNECTTTVSRVYKSKSDCEIMAQTYGK